MAEFDTLDSLAQDVHERFSATGQTWRFRGEDGEPVHRVPNVEDIKGMLKTMSSTLDESPESLTIEFPVDGARILMRINDGIKDVYVHYGEMEQDDY